MFPRGTGGHGKAARGQSSALVLLVIALAGAGPVRAADPQTAGERWVRVGESEAVAIAAVLAFDLPLELFLKAAETPHWQRGILFDDSVRDALTARSAAGRSRAGTLSDIGLFGLAAFPLVVDAALVTWLGRGHADGAVQLALVDVEALAITWGLATLIERSVSRARPYMLACATDPTRPECSGDANQRNTAFLSGHTSVAFAAASVLCVQHTRLELYGKADSLVCALAVAAAAGVGVSRIVAEKHWATDVIAGATLGTAVGTIVGLSHTRSSEPSTIPRATVFGDGNSFRLTFGGSF